jgi:hypothetical protein
MKPQTSNHRLWLMIALLGGVVLGGVGARLDRYWSSTPSLDPGMYLLPRNEMGFGRDVVVWGVESHGHFGHTVIADRIRLGFFAVRLR